MPTHPVEWRLIVAYPLGAEFAPIARALLHAVQSVQAPLHWQLGGASGPQGQSCEPLGELLSQDLGSWDGYLRLSLSEADDLSLVRRGNALLLHARCPGSASARRAAGWLKHMAAIATQLLEAAPAVAAEIHRAPRAEGFFMPSPPLARYRHLFLTDLAEVEQVYASASATMLAGWSERRDMGERLLLVRALDCVSEEAWAAHCLDYQLRLAKMAPPHSTEWSRAVLADWNRRWLAAPHQQLRFVGHDASSGLVEFTATVGPEGLTIGELQSLHELRAQGRDRRGRVVTSIRVVYLTLQQAAIDAVVLGDLGISCCTLSADGTLLAVEPH